MTNKDLQAIDIAAEKSKQAQRNENMAYCCAIHTAA